MLNTVATAIVLTLMFYVCVCVCVCRVCVGLHHLQSAFYFSLKSAMAALSSMLMLGGKHCKGIARLFLLRPAPAAQVLSLGGIDHVTFVAGVQPQEEVWQSVEAVKELSTVLTAVTLPQHRRVRDALLFLCACTAGACPRLTELMAVSSLKSKSAADGKGTDFFLGQGKVVCCLGCKSIKSGCATVCPAAVCTRV